MPKGYENLTRTDLRLLVHAKSQALADYSGRDRPSHKYVRLIGEDLIALADAMRDHKSSVVSDPEE